MKWLSEELEVWLIAILVYIVLIVIISIKERENIFTNIVQFFKEWSKHIITFGIPITIILVIIVFILELVFPL